MALLAASRPSCQWNGLLSIRLPPHTQRDNMVCLCDFEFDPATLCSSPCLLAFSHLFFYYFCQNLLPLNPQKLPCCLRGQICLSNSSLFCIESSPKVRASFPLKLNQSIPRMDQSHLFLLESGQLWGNTESRSAYLCLRKVTSSVETAWAL